MTAGCASVHVVPSADGRTVWVTARGSDQLLAFSATKLHADPTHSPLTPIGVSEAPIGLAIVDRGREIVVADSNRFGTPVARADLTVVRTAAALARHPALLGTIPTSTYPREMAR